jgi:flagellar hook assembly protein FlgD
VLVNVKDSVLPNYFALNQNYPNPFNPLTTISYDLPAAGRVRLQIYDMDGRFVTQLVNSDRNAGRHSVQWDATDHAGRQVANGVYFCTMTSGEFYSTIKLTVLK